MGKSFKSIFDRTKNSVKKEGKDYVIVILRDEFAALSADSFFERRLKFDEIVCYLASENQKRINAMGGKHGYCRSW